MPGEDRDLREVVRELESRVAALERQAAFKPASKLPTQSAFGLKAVNRIGAITLAIGIIFFFKYAADNEWIGPAARVVFGIVAGVGLIAASEWLGRREQSIFGQGLAGCGLAILYIAFYAAFGYYKLIGAATAFFILVALCAGTILLSVYKKNAAIALLGFSGALLTPQLIELTSPDTWVYIEAVYLFVLDVTALIIARLQGSRLLVSLAAALVAVTAIAQLNHHHVYPFVILMASLAVLHFASRARIAAEAEIIGHTFTLFALLHLLAAWTTHSAFSNTLGSILLAVYGIGLLAAGLTRGSNLHRGLGLVYLGLVIAKLYLYDIWQLNYASRITAFVVLGILLLTASFLYGRSKSQSS